MPSSTRCSASAARRSPITRSVGSSTLARPGSVAFASARRACSTSSSPHSDSPTPCPCAQRNGKHIAPPMITTSARSRKRSITPILSATFAPPITATSGRGGFSRIFVSVRTSRSSSLPAALGSRCATPSVLACARCAAPKASSTYTSASSESARASAGSLVVSPASKRTFSSTSSSPLAELLGQLLGALADDLGRERHARVRSARAGARRRAPATGPPRGAPRGARGARRARGSRRARAAPRSSPAPRRCACRRRRAGRPSASLPSGTLKSTRTSTRLPSTSRSSSVLIATPPSSACAPSR